MHAELGMAVALGLFASACGGPSGGTAAGLQGQLDGRTFVSESVEGWQLVAGSEVRVAFKGSQLSATAGCNSIGGPFTIQGNALAMQGYSMTNMGCAAPLLEQDQWLVNFLLAGPSLKLVEPRLIMTTPNARMTLLDRKIASPDRPLVGTQWAGDGFSDGAVASSLPASAQVSAFFDPNGSVTIFTGCETGTGTYQVAGATLTFQAFAYDGAPCTSGNQATSDEVKLVLDGSLVSFSIQEQSLTLTHGKYSLSFRSAT